MIVTVTLNPAVDKTLLVESLIPGQVHRVLSSRQDEGGKGINVSKVLKSLGLDSAATGFLGGASGEYILSKLRERGIRADFVSVSGETRTNIKVTSSDGTTTDLNEKGTPIPAEEYGKLRHHLQSLTKPGDIVLFAGSLYNGSENTVYAELVSDCRERGVRTMVDTSGEALQAAAKAIPTVLKPNLEELGQLLGKIPESREEIVSACRKLLSGGIERIAVTLGSEGALLFTEREAWCAGAVPVKVSCTVGSGDAFAAGLLYAMEKGYSDDRALAFAVGAGSANAAKSGTEPPSAEDIREMVSLVSVQKIKYQ